MILIRLVAAVLAALAATLAILGFAVTDSLSQSQQFVAAMDQAIEQPAVQAEVAAAVKQQVQAAGESLAGGAGPLGGLARAGAEVVAAQVDAAVAGQVFNNAWGQWSRLLYDGLADYAAGSPNDDVSVSGSTITVAIGSLVAPIVGDNVAGGFTGTLEAVGRSTDVTISTGLPVQQGLKATGALSQWRWLFAAAAAVFALVAVLSGQRKLRWLGVTLLLAAGATAGSWLAMQAATTTPPAGSDTPQLSLAVTQALVTPWAEQLRQAALALGIGGVIALVLGLFLGRPKS